MHDIVIHGASSFLGKNFIKSLTAKGVCATVIGRSTSQLDFCKNCPTIKIYKYNNSISEINHKNIALENPVFYELSWHGVFGSYRNSPEQLTINVPLIISSIDFARRLSARHWIGIGSQAEYGDLNKEITENDTCFPTTIYGKSKLICSKISEELCSLYNIEFSWLRLFSVFGPDDNHEWLIPYLIKEMLQNREVNVTKGEQVWDYLYIDDVTELLLMMEEAKGIGIANLGSGEPIPIKELIEKIKILSCSKSVINYGAIQYLPNQVMYMSANINRLTTHIDWRPKTNLEDGLMKTIDFFRNE